MKFIDSLRAKLSGKKVYALMAVGVVASVVQYLAGINLGIPDLPPAGDIGALGQQIWVFTLGAAARSTVGKL
jgi:hypothetical protein